MTTPPAHPTIARPVYKGYHVTDGYEEMRVADVSRAKATGVFIRRFGKSVDWKRLRTRRAPEMDGDHAYSWDVGAFCTVSYWGAAVRLP